MHFKVIFLKVTHIYVFGIAESKELYVSCMIIQAQLLAILTIIFTNRRMRPVRRHWLRALLSNWFILSARDRNRSGLRAHSQGQQTTDEPENQGSQTSR